MRLPSPRPVCGRIMRGPSPSWVTGTKARPPLINATSNWLGRLGQEKHLGVWHRDLFGRVFGATSLGHSPGQTEKPLGPAYRGAPLCRVSGQLDT